ncbi:uncharacterized protein BO66DRAFT_203313 [Aspergillus aculeatinus CBS 121060]|uniref:Uncharacterized protein n=1 Tax=Aspergillus aculeatinus CBS 121060 TaxID=1448322 RepID=A0ACD1HJG8_9EURO|nr:hypothetical protein BO66DRAFT_203313 [Aspergillus aculeatinus CBS 121060]RAH73671.1 hypothetical protein BO66DRAFT_203313 [Aspergillus aculeatinus CBS 121060]
MSLFLLSSSFCVSSISPCLWFHLLYLLSSTFIYLICFISLFHMSLFLTIFPSSSCCFFSYFVYLLVYGFICASSCHLSHLFYLSYLLYLFYLFWLFHLSHFLDFGELGVLSFLLSCLIFAILSDLFLSCLICLT